MKNSLDAIRSGLESQDAELARDEQTATKRLADLRRTRKRVKAALKALAADEATTRAPNQAQVRRAMKGLLDDNGGAVAAEDLEALVTEKLAHDEDRSAVGLKLRMKELFSSGEFAVTGGYVKQAPTGVSAATTGRSAASA